MREQLHDTAYFQDTPRDNALDVFMDELIAQQLETPGSEAFHISKCEIQSPDADLLEAPPPTSFSPETGEEATPENAIETPAMPDATDTDAGLTLMSPEPASEPDAPAPSEPMPVRVYSFSDLMLFDQLTGYRLVAQRQLWRAVDKEGNRSMAGDRLFTVLAEEAFQMADRKRRNGPNPISDLTIRDIAIALEPMRSIAAHLGERGIKAADRLEAIVVATLNRRAAA